MIADLPLNKSFAVLPPAYQKLFLRLNAIRINRKLSIIPFDTVYFVFEGFYISRKRTARIIDEFEKLGTY